MTLTHFLYSTYCALLGAAVVRATQLDIGDDFANALDTLQMRQASLPTPQQITTTVCKSNPNLDFQTCYSNLLPRVLSTEGTHCFNTFTALGQCKQTTNDCSAQQSASDSCSSTAIKTYQSCIAVGRTTPANIQLCATSALGVIIPSASLSSSAPTVAASTPPGSVSTALRTAGTAPAFTNSSTMTAAPVFGSGVPITAVSSIPYFTNNTVVYSNTTVVYTSTALGAIPSGPGPVITNATSSSLPGRSGTGILAPSFTNTGFFTNTTGTFSLLPTFASTASNTDIVGGTGTTFGAARSTPGTTSYPTGASAVSSLMSGGVPSNEPTMTSFPSSPAQTRFRVGDIFTTDGLVCTVKTRVQTAT